MKRTTSLVTTSRITRRFTGWQKSRGSTSLPTRHPRPPFSPKLVASATVSSSRKAGVQKAPSRADWAFEEKQDGSHSSVLPQRPNHMVRASYRVDQVE